MKHALLILTLGLAAHAGPLLEASGGGEATFGWGWGNPEWDFSIAGVSCDMTDGPDCWGTDLLISLQPLAGQQTFTIAENQNGVIGDSQEYETFGTITSLSCTWLAPGFANVCTESFSFSAVALDPGAPLTQTGSSDPSVVPEPSTWLLVMAGVGLVGLWRKRKTLRVAPQKGLVFSLPRGVPRRTLGAP